MPPEEAARSLLTRDGVRLAYWLTPARERAAASPRRAVLLLHGMASNHTRWSEFCARTRLSASWDLLRLDLRGHGDSLVRGRVDMSIWCEDLAEILAQEGIDETVVVGHCLGANLALHFANRMPEKVRGLVLIEPMLPEALTGQLAAAARWRPLFQALVPFLRLAAKLGLHRRCLRALDLEALDRQARETLARTGEFPAARFASVREDLQSLPLVIYLQDLIAVTGPLPALSRIDAPALVLLAGGGGFGDTAATARALAPLPHGEIRRIAAQHWIPTEQPEALREAVEQWCRDPDSAPHACVPGRFRLDAKGGRE